MSAMASKDISPTVRMVVQSVHRSSLRQGILVVAFLASGEAHSGDLLQAQKVDGSQFDVEVLSVDLIAPLDNSVRRVGLLVSSREAEHIAPGTILTERGLALRPPVSREVVDWSSIDSSQLERLVFELLLERVSPTSARLGIDSGVDGGADVVLTYPESHGAQVQSWIQIWHTSDRPSSLESVQRTWQRAAESHIARMVLVVTLDLPTEAKVWLNQAAMPSIEVWTRSTIEHLLEEYPASVSRAGLPAARSLQLLLSRHRTWQHSRDHRLLVPPNELPDAATRLKRVDDETQAYLLESALWGYEELRYWAAANFSNPAAALLMGEVLLNDTHVRPTVRAAYVLQRMDAGLRRQCVAKVRSQELSPLARSLTDALVADDPLLRWLRDSRSRVLLDELTRQDLIDQLDPEPRGRRRLPTQ